MDTTPLLCLFVLFLLGYFYLRKKRRAYLPPGPWAVPIFGGVPFLDKDLRKEALRLSKEYNSDVIRIQLGPFLAVFLNSFDSIRAAMTSEDFLDRPNIMFFLVWGKQGIGSSDGQLWKEHRRLALSVLRNLGMGKMAAEEKIRDQTRYLIDEITKRGNKSFDIGPILNITAANVISSIILGERYSYDDPGFLNVVFRVQEMLALLGHNSILGMFPSLRHLPGNLFNVGTLFEHRRHVFSFLDEHIKKHKERFDPDNISDFLDTYLLEKKKQDERNPQNTFTDNQLKLVVSDLFAGGTETSAATLRFGILFMIAHPEIQRKVQAEIDDAMGRDRIPTMHDRPLLPYTEATVLETHRFAGLIGLGSPHSNLNRDVTFRKYTIPKGSLIFQNIWAVHRDPKIWKYPDVFDPRNFLDDQGAVVYKHELLTFGIGRRQCPGESLAKVEVFLVFTSLLQKFFFVNPEGASMPDIDGVFTSTNDPGHFEVCVQARGEETTK